MDPEQLKAIGINVKNIGDQLIGRPDITGTELATLAQALHIAAQTLRIVAEKSA